MIYLCFQDGSFVRVGIELYSVGEITEFCVSPVAGNREIPRHEQASKTNSKVCHLGLLCMSN